MQKRYARRRNSCSKVDIIIFIKYFTNLSDMPSFLHFPGSSHQRKCTVFFSLIASILRPQSANPPPNSASLCAIWTTLGTFIGPAWKKVANKMSVKSRRSVGGAIHTYPVGIIVTQIPSQFRKFDFFQSIILVDDNETARLWRTVWRCSSINVECVMIETL